jgi:hypothetical protein
LFVITAHRPPQAIGVVLLPQEQREYAECASQNGVLVCSFDTNVCQKEGRWASPIFFFLYVHMVTAKLQRSIFDYLVVSLEGSCCTHEIATFEATYPIGTGYVALKVETLKFPNAV